MLLQCYVRDNTYPRRRLVCVIITVFFTSCHVLYSYCCIHGTSIFNSKSVVVIIFFMIASLHLSAWLLLGQVRTPYVQLGWTYIQKPIFPVYISCKVEVGWLQIYISFLWKCTQITTWSSHMPFSSHSHTCTLCFVSFALLNA